ncbi:MAG: hypothetical protein U0Q03_17805 [Acidimicrobiales bacterium]
MSTTTPPPRSSGWFSGRTRLITLVSIAVVGVAGATAVSANLGILDTAADSPVGQASAVGDVTAPQVVEVTLPPAAPAATAAPLAADGVQEFAVDVAGTVGVVATADGVRLDRVTPSSGWSWTSTQSAPTTLLVTMTDGSRTFEFTATSAADGTIAADVVEPVVTPAAPVAQGGHGDDGHEGGEHEEYEGGEDDD